jgi:predicted MFS family arabinose efflux permease
MPKFSHTLKNRDFLLLWLGQIISQLGDRLGFMALLGFAYAKSGYGRPAEVFKILLFTIIPVFVIGPIAGVYVDRWDRRKTMYLCDLLRMGLVAIIPIFLFYSRNLPLAYTLVFLVFCVARFFLPAKLSIVPELVAEKDLLIANSLVNVTGMIAFIIGSGIGGVVVEMVGAEKGFYLDALSFLLSAVLIFFISLKPKSSVGLRAIGGEIVEVIRKSAIGEMKEGLLYLARKKDIRLSALVLFALASALGIVSVVSIVFVQNTLHSATKDLGLLIMFLGAGLFAGTLAYGRFGHRFSHYRGMAISLIFSGICLIIFTLCLNRYPVFVVAAGLAFLLGIAVSPLMTIINTIIHIASDNQMRGKIFSSLEVVMHLGFLLFMYISSLLANRYSHVSILVATGCVFCLLGLVTVFCYRKIPWLN